MLSKISFIYKDGDGPTEKELPMYIGTASPKQSYLLRIVNGLNPPQRDLFIHDFSRDGGSYQGRRVGFRNVVMTVDLNPDLYRGETVQGLREDLERITMGSYSDSREVRLRFEYDDQPAREIVAYTETFENEVFEQENTVQISMICPDPYIRAQKTVRHTHANGWIQMPISYVGTAETGFEVRVEVKVRYSDHITFVVDNKTMILHHRFLEGDVIGIDTNPGSRKITLTRESEVRNIVSKLDIRSEWLTIGPSTRQVRVYGETPSALNATFQDLVYTPLYWGV